MSIFPALATAASLPPELVKISVKFIGTNDRGWGSGTTCDRDLAAASLVCIEWANTCRRRRFRSLLVPSRVTLRSPFDLQTLESFTTNGSKRLVPLHSLVRFVIVQQNWDSRSWCHSLRTSVFYKMAASVGNPLEFKTLTLELSGPVPAHLPLSAYHSPTWNLPRTLPQCFLPFTHVVLQDIRFPSISDMLILLRNLTYLSSIACERLTWDKADVSFVDPGVNRYRRRAMPDTPALHSVSARGCLDNALVVALALRYHPSDSQTPFSSMGLYQQDACFAILRACSFVGEGSGGTERLLDASASLSEISLSDAFLQDIPGISTEPLETIIYEGDAAEFRQDEEFGRDATSITCAWYCSPEHSNVPASTQQVIGLQLNFRNEIEDGRCLGDFKQALAVFRSKLAAFPHLKVAGVQAEPETILQDITQAWPELGRRPTGEPHQELYWRWGNELYTPQVTEADAPQDTQVDALQATQL